MRPMRRFRQELTAEECVQVLERGTHGVLAVLGDEGYPYAVPLSYVHGEGKIWFHCAKAGHKLDAIRNYNKVSFCVVDQDRIVPEEYPLTSAASSPSAPPGCWRTPGRSARPWRLWPPSIPRTRRRGAARRSALSFPM